MKLRTKRGQTTLRRPRRVRPCERLIWMLSARELGSRGAFAAWAATADFHICPWDSLDFAPRRGGCGGCGGWRQSILAASCAAARWCQYGSQR